MDTSTKPVGRPHKYFQGMPISNSYKGYRVINAWGYDPNLVMSFLKRCKDNCNTDMTILLRWENHFRSVKVPFVTIFDGEYYFLYKLRP